MRPVPLTINDLNDALVLLREARDENLKQAEALRRRRNPTVHSVAASRADAEAARLKKVIDRFEATVAAMR